MATVWLCVWKAGDVRKVPRRLHNRYEAVASNSVMDDGANAAGRSWMEACATRADVRLKTNPAYAHSLTRPGTAGISSARTPKSFATESSTRNDAAGKPSRANACAASGVNHYQYAVKIISKQNSTATIQNAKLDTFDFVIGLPSQANLPDVLETVASRAALPDMRLPDPSRSLNAPSEVGCLPVSESA